MFAFSLSSFALAAVLFAHGEREAVVLPRGGVEVVVARQNPNTVLFAADEATNFLSRVLGEPVPIVARPGGKKVSIVLGTNVWSEAAGVRVDGFARDEYRIRVSGLKVYIAGLDDDVDIAERIASGWDDAKFNCGTLFGVYDFLERFAGVRFYFPGEMGTVIPSKVRISVSGDITVKPDLAVRDCFIAEAGDWPDENGAPLTEREANGRRLLYRLRLREREYGLLCCHGQNKFMIAERFSKTHPEYFQLREDGTRCTGTKFEYEWQGRQLCHTSPVWDVFRNETIERMRKGERLVDISPQDAMQACRCTNCLARYKSRDYSLNSGFANELIWSNVAVVARAVADAGLKGMVIMGAYGTCREPPRVEVPTNVYVEVALGGPWSESHPDLRDVQVDLVRRWHEKLGRKVNMLWTYPMKNFERLMAKDIPQYAPHAYLSFYSRVAPYTDGIFAQTACGGGEKLHIVHSYMNFYVFSKFGWNRSFDLEAALDEHYRLMFGRGADDMKTFFELLEKKWIGDIAIPSVIGETEYGPVMYRTPPPEEIKAKVFTPETMTCLRRCLDRAAGKTSKDTMSSRRVRWIRSEFYEPLAARYEPGYSRGFRPRE